MLARAVPTDGTAGTVLVVALCAAAVQPAFAAVDVSAGVTVGGQYDTNARQLASIELPPLQAEGRTIARDDASMNVGANVAARIGSGPLRAQAQISYTHSESMRSEALNHDDYSFAASVNWAPNRAFDFSLQGTQNRLPLGLADVGGQESTPQTSSSAQGTLRVRPTPQWQLSLTPGWSETRTPLEGAEDFRLQETRGTLSIEFPGAGRLVPGVSVSQSEGTYFGVPRATRYTQRAVSGTLSYRLTEVTAFSLSGGQTWRTTRLRVPTNDPAAVAIEGKDSAFTGSLSLSRQLTAKTGVNLNFFRNFQQYDAGVNTTLGTGFSAGVNWAATPKVSATLQNSFTWSVIDNATVSSGVPARRVDLVRSYSLGLSYLATRAVSFNANVTRNVRRSEVWTDQYNSTIVGLSLSIGFD